MDPKPTSDTKTFDGLILDKREVCAAVKASFPTIWARIKAGDFPPARSRGGKVFWIRSEIEAYLLEAPVVVYGGRKFDATAKDAKPQSAVA